MKKSFLLALLFYLLTINSISSADIIRGINVDFVPIIGGADSDLSERDDGTSGYGAVSYNYRIGKYEITNAQWEAFTAATGAPTGNLIDAYDQDGAWLGDQKPKVWISWYEAAQFCNYLTSGDKSKGAYIFNGNNSNPGDFVDIDRFTALSTYGKIYVIPTEDEWYRAAYHKPDGSGYSLYANGSNMVPAAGVDTNYDDPLGQPWEVDNGTAEQNGTFDMMGNVFEWNETPNGLLRGVLGGSYENTSLYISAYHNDYGFPYYEGVSGGFRIVEIPEPATFLLLGLSGLVLRKRQI